MLGAHAATLTHAIQHIASGQLFCTAVNIMKSSMRKLLTYWHAPAMQVFMFIVNDKGTSWAYATPGFANSLNTQLLKQLRCLADVPEQAKLFTEASTPTTSLAAACGSAAIWLSPSTILYFASPVAIKLCQHATGLNTLLTLEREP